MKISFIVIQIIRTLLNTQDPDTEEVTRTEHGNYIMPSPRKDESEDQFISRCMSDEEMKGKHPKQDERYAVCKSFWDNKDKGDEED
jgi:hypothetical protein